MNSPVHTTTAFSVCPHDCPSTCALEVEVVDNKSIGRVRGAKDNSYTAGVVCAKVGRYSERVHHEDRLLYPLRRSGRKGCGNWERVNWDDALDMVAEAFLRAEQRFGSQTIWPYRYAGTMGHVQRDGLARLTNTKRYSRQHDTFCTNMAWTGIVAGTGKLAGPDPREITKSDLVVIWGTNPVNTQVNVMTHAVQARKERGAKIVAVDIYQNGTMEQADLALCLRPGTDGALACAVMHILFRDDLADRDYLAKYADCPEELEAHLQSRTPQWASEITGLPVSEIEEFAALIGANKRAFFRLGYGFTRSRNGAVNMHAALCIPTVIGAWQYEGGGGFHSNSGIYHLNKTMVEALDVLDPSVRYLDQSQIGPILTGDKTALKDGPQVTGLLVQNTNPVSVAPRQELVKEGFARGNLFTCVHEQFMTETAAMADVVLPATMFVEHDDIYTGGGHQHLVFGPKLIDPPGECRSNHFVHCELAKRLGVDHPGFHMSEREHIDWMLQNSGWGDLEEFERNRWIDCQPDFNKAHYIDGFKWPDGKFRFKVDWAALDAPNSPPDKRALGPAEQMPQLPDYWAVTKEADADHPFRLATSPSRSFLNSTFNETPSGRAREGQPTVMIHPDDAAEAGISDGQKVRMGNRFGEIVLHAEFYAGVRRGVLISEGIWPNCAFEDGRGINTLTGADSVAPTGGAAFHDNHVWLRPADGRQP